MAAGVDDGGTGVLVGMKGTAVAVGVGASPPVVIGKWTTTVVGSGVQVGGMGESATVGVDVDVGRGAGVSRRETAVGDAGCGSLHPTSKSPINKIIDLRNNLNLV